MSDLKDKHSGSRLNPSERNFEDIVNQPDMQALNDRGDAIARDDEVSKLRGAENDATSDTKKGENGEEPQPKNEPENKFGYQPNQQDNNRTKLPSRRNFWIAAGAGGGTIAALIAGFMALTPLKVPGMMNMVTSATTQRMENIVQERAKLILGRAILTKFGTNSGIVLAGGPVDTLIATMRTNNFEKKLAAKGITIEGSGKNTTVRVQKEVIYILGDDDYEKGTITLVNKLDGTPAGRKALREIVNEEIPAWRWFKRVKFARWLSYKHNIPYGLKNSQETDPEKREADVQRQRKATDDARLKGFFSTFVTCLSAGKCEGVNSSGDAEDLGDNMGAVENAVADATTETVEDITQSSRKILIEKLSSKAIPIVGWIDLLATIDHFINEGLGGTNDFMGELVAYQKGLAYGAVYAEWAGYGSQIELGAMAPDHVGTLSDALNDAETAESFQAIQKNSASAGGVPIETTVNSSDSSNVKELYDNIINSPFGKPYELVGHPVLDAYYETIGGGGLLGWVFSKIGTLATKILAEPTKYGLKIVGAVTPESVEKAIENTLYDLAPIILKSIGVTISSLEKGAGLINNIVGGGVVSANDHCKEIGCRKLSTEQAIEQNRQTEADRLAYRQDKGLFYTLFSTEEPTSLTSQLAINTPTEPAAALSTVGRLISTVPGKLTGMIFPQVLADDPMALEKLYKVSPYGATENDLSQPLSAQSISGDDCPEVSEDGFNTCTLDKSTAESMLCEFNENNEDCSDSAGTTDDGSDSPLTCSAVPSWTKLPATIDAPIGGAVSGTVDMAVANIQKGSGVNSSLNTLTNDKPDFLSLNEIGETSLNSLEAAAPGYGAYREAQADGGPGGGLRSLDNAILWKKDKWTFLQGGRIKVTEDDTGYHNGNPFTWDRWAVWATFKRSDGAIVSVISTHMMTNPQKFPAQHSNPDLTRIQQYKQSMEILLQLTSVLAAHGPVLVGGDMNTHVTQGNWSAVPMMKQAGFGYANDGAVVYLFHPQGTKLVSQRNVAIDSDHPALRAKIDMNGIGPGAITGGSGDCASGVAGNWSLPVDRSGWESDGPRWLEAHTTISDAWTNSIKAGSDINIGSDNDDCGKPVYSMLGGTIVSGAPGYTMQVKSLVNGKEVIITYAHGTSMKTSGAVKAGDQIMVIGNKSSYTGMKCHLHLEVKYGSKAICPQKILPTIAGGQQPNLDTVPEATFACGS